MRGTVRIGARPAMQLQARTPVGSRPVSDRRLILAAAFLRSTALGLMGPTLAFHLASLRFDDDTIGAVSSAGLAGAALPVLLLMLAGERLPRRNVLLAVSALSVLGAVAAAFATTPGVVGIAAFVGMLNAMGRDRGACLVVEQAMLPETGTDAERTRTFAWHSVMQDGGGAAGAFLVRLPQRLSESGGMDDAQAMRATVLVYAALVAAGAVPYLLLSRAVAAAPSRGASRVSPASRTVLAKLCGLFAVDSVAGGFLTAAFLTTFFVKRFGADAETVSNLFVAKSVLNAASHLGAAWLAKRIGLVNTMVFTHAPSSVLLMTAAVAPSFGVAAALFLVREGLVEMDVPTRNSYLMAVVRPEERTFASGATHLVRVAGWAIAPVLGGWAASRVDIALPIWIAGTMKIAYDALLWRAFRRAKPPEERTA
jgi:MFS family permease